MSGAGGGSDRPAGLLLAGGASRRFGADKARVVVEGRTMIEHVYDALSAAAHPVFVSLGVRTQPFALTGPVRYVWDRYPDAGPLAGLHAGLLAAPGAWLLAVACDMPRLDGAALRRLADGRTPEADAVVARTPDGRVHPLCACYHRRILPVVEAHLAAGTFALHALLDRLDVQPVDLPADPLHNVNTPTDLRDVRKRRDSPQDSAS